MNNVFLTANAQLQRIVFWEPCISPHKTEFLNAVSMVLPNIEIICCAHQDLPDVRKDLGWITARSDRIATIISPGPAQIETLVYEDGEYTLHIFSGTRHLSTLILGLRFVKSCGACFAIMSEPRVLEGLIGILRFLQSWVTERWIRKNCKFILAIGRSGPSWFKMVGYESENIFPFAYFVAPPALIQNPLSVSQDVSNSHITRIGYIGRLVAMKGIFDLVTATKYLDKDVHLVFVGAGADKDELQEKCLEYNVDTDFCGVLPMDEIGEVLKRIDVLVLASTSKDDGWGVVVSEALMAGAAVIATDKVGASVMLGSDIFGDRVAARSPIEIAKAIKRLISSDAFTNKNRLTRQKLAKSRLSPMAGAHYFSEILHFQFGEGDPPKPFFLYENEWPNLIN